MPCLSEFSVWLIEFQNAFGFAKEISSHSNAQNSKSKMFFWRFAFEVFQWYDFWHEGFKFFRQYFFNFLQSNWTFGKSLDGPNSTQTRLNNFEFGLKCEPPLINSCRVPTCCLSSHPNPSTQHEKSESKFAFPIQLINELNLGLIWHARYHFIIVIKSGHINFGLD